VDDQNIPGMDQVDRLAEYLVELRTSTGLTLSRQQVCKHFECLLTWKRPNKTQCDCKNSVTELCMRNYQFPF